MSIRQPAGRDLDPSFSRTGRLARSPSERLEPTRAPATPAAAAGVTASRAGCVRSCAF